MYSKKKYFGFGKNSCITSKKGKSKQKPKPCPVGVFLFGVVVPCKKGQRRPVDPSLN